MARVSIEDLRQDIDHWIEQVSRTRAAIVVTEGGKGRAVLLNVEAFEDLIGIPHWEDEELLPLDELRQEMKRVFAEAGYHTREDSVALVREVKQELAHERAQCDLPRRFRAPTSS